MPDRVLTEAENGTTVDIAIGSRLTIRLRENPTTGYRWSLTGEAPGLALQSDDFRAPKGAGVGGGGMREFVFTADRAGEVSIEAILSRSWERGVTPEAIFRIRARVE